MSGEAALNEAKNIGSEVSKGEGGFILGMN